MVTLVSLMYNIPVQNQLDCPSGNKYGIVRNFHSKFKDIPTKLGANFLFGDRLYSYDLEFLADGNILNEKLETYENYNEVGRKPKLIYSRNLEGQVETGPAYEDMEKYSKNTILLKSQNLFSLLLLQGFHFVSDFRDKIFMWNIGNSDSMPGIVSVMGAGL